MNSNDEIAIYFQTIELHPILWHLTEFFSWKWMYKILLKRVLRILHIAYLAAGLNRYDCVGRISDPPPTEYRTHRIKYLNRGLFWVYQTLGGHGHSGGYDQLLFVQIMPD